MESCTASTLTTSVTPDWNDLRPFLALARTGSLAGAARALGTRHSTVSRRIDALEQALGLRLVQRMPTGAMLTEAGLRLVPLAQTAEPAMAEFAAAATGTSRVWRVSLPTGLAPIVGSDLAALTARRPDRVVDLHSSSTSVDLAGGAVDIAVRMRPVDAPALVARQVGEAGWSLYASPRYLAQHPFGGTLAGHDLVGFHADLAGSPADLWLSQHGSGGRMVLRLAQMADLMATVGEGLGIAILPCVLADPAEGLERLTDEVLVRHPVLLAYRADVADDPRGRDVIRCLTAALKRVGGALTGERG